MGKALMGFQHYSMRNSTLRNGYRPGNDSNKENHVERSTYFALENGTGSTSGEDDYSDEDTNACSSATVGIEDDILLSVAKHGGVSFVFQRFG